MLNRISLYILKIIQSKVKIRQCSAVLAPDFKLPVKCIFLVLNIGTSLVAIFGNALVMLILHTTPRLKTQSNYLLLFLAGTHLIVGLIAQPITCILVINYLYLDKVCIISQILACVYHKYWPCHPVLVLGY